MFRGGLTLNTDGTITVGSTTPSGTYQVEYQICENGANPANCDRAIAIVEVKNDLIAKDDNLGTIATSTTATTAAGSVLANNGNGVDTLNGVAVTTANTDVTPVTTGSIRIDVDGNVTIQPSTPSGTYTIPYTICETGAIPVNCKTANITVEVKNTIDAVDDAKVTVASGGNTPNVTLNDKLNGSNVTIGAAVGQVSLTGVNIPVGLTLNTDGTITVGSTTPSGTYQVEYQICENGANPANCDRAIAIVEVKNDLIAKDDNLGTIATSATATTAAGSVLANNGSGFDTLNGVAVTTANTDVTPVTTGSIRIDVDGNVTIQPVPQVVLTRFLIQFVKQELHQ
ncbi:hypothetical protein [Flavobacterium davisii]|uniref:Uncharacterized protein n=1 Tax=Flavobacterium columnare TaxID=996 RepID=A0A8G0KRD7_9FLAO|nr:hypothetical protein [Flavobacterium davisii]QYS88661.1 hypothetical protein JJC05_13910 [Flavobacterium davisii]